MKKGINAVLVLIVVMFLVDVNLYAQGVIFFDDFASGSLDPAWTARPSINGEVGGFVAVSPEAAHDGFMGVAIGRITDGEFTTNALDLHLDLSIHDQVELNFWIKNISDETDPSDGIWFSDD